MKKHIGIAALMFGLFLTFFTQACKEDSNGPSDDYDEEVYKIEDSDEMSDVEMIDATLESETAVWMYEIDDDSDNEGPRIKSKKPNNGYHFGFFFRKLDLNNTQKAQLKDYMRDYRECVKDNRESIFEAVRVILDKAELDRDLIVDKYHTGEYTKVEAEAELAILNARTRMELQTDDTIDNAIDNIRNCRSNLIDSIKSMLSEQQREEFDDLLD